MKPEERAEKIFYIVQEQYGSECLGRIAVQIAEAEREARIGQSDADHSEAYDEGFAAARAKAAGVLRNHEGYLYTDITAKIEAMEP